MIILIVSSKRGDQNVNKTVASKKSLTVLGERSASKSFELRNVRIFFFNLTLPSTYRYGISFMYKQFKENHFPFKVMRFRDIDDTDFI